MAENAPTLDDSGVSPPEQVAPRIPIIALGMSLGLFLSITFVLCVLFDLVFPTYAMNEAWAPLFPGFTWLSWPSFLIGLVESFAYGWYIAVIFGPLYNLLAARLGGVAGDRDKGPQPNIEHRPF